MNQPFKVMVMTPSSGVCRIQYALSLAHMVQHFNTFPVYPEHSEQEITLKYWEGTGVSQNREEAVRELLASDFNHILFIDDDMGFNSNVLHILAGRRVPIVGCNYRIRRPPAIFMAHRDKQEIQTTAASGGLEAVDFMGLGMCLINRQVFESIPEPRFMLKWLDFGPNKPGRYSTEDSQFFKRAADEGWPILIDHDASKLIWHNGNIAYTWADDFSNINKLWK